MENKNYLDRHMSYEEHMKDERITKTDITDEEIYSWLVS